MTAAEEAILEADETLSNAVGLAALACEAGRLLARLEQRPQQPQPPQPTAAPAGIGAISTPMSFRRYRP